MSLITDHIREFEGFSATAYRDVGGVWTIGFGHTGPDVHEGMVITKDRAEELLYTDLAWVRATIRETVKVKLTAGQEAAITGLVYNIGPEAWRKSTALRRLNALDYLGAADALTWFNKVKGEVIKGLVRRREAERALFLSGLGKEADAAGGIEGGEAKPLNHSKEVATSITGVLATVGAIWSEAQTQVGPLLAWAGERAMWVLLALFLFFLANRIIASRKGER